MDASTIILIIIVIAALAVIAVLSNKKKKEMIGKGEILDRPHDFIEKAEIFTLRYVDGATVQNAVQKFDSKKMCFTGKCDSQRQIYIFASSNGGRWTAQLQLTVHEGDLMAYRFEFTHWHRKNGFYVGDVYMNMLLTSIEKMFLSFDPNTKVRTEKVEYKTKRTWG